VQDTLTSISSGPARRLLQDVARLAAGVYAQGSAGENPEVVEHLGALLDLSCDVAVDLGHLDESVMILEHQEDMTERQATGAAETGWLESLARARRARDGLTHRLLGVMAILGRTRIAIASGESAAHDLTTFATALERDATAHAEALREVEALAG